MAKGIANIATKEDITGFKDSLISDLRKINVNLLRWMFFFQITQTLLIWGLSFYLLKK